MLSHTVYTGGGSAPTLPPLSSQRWGDFNPPLRLRNIYTDRKGREWPARKRPRWASHVWGMDDVTFLEWHHLLGPSEADADPGETFLRRFCA